MRETLSRSFASMMVSIGVLEPEVNKQSGEDALTLQSCESDLL